MKKIIVSIIACVALSGVSAFANENQGPDQKMSLDQRKTMVLTHINEMKTNLAQFESCVINASTKEALKSCKQNAKAAREQMKQKREQMKAERQNMNQQRMNP